MTALWLLALACTVRERTWTETGAVAPSLARMDRDHDGRVEEAEYSATAFAAPPFSEVDRDADGTLSVIELNRLIREQDPSAFDGQGVVVGTSFGVPVPVPVPVLSAAPPRPAGPPPPGSTPLASLELLRVLQTLQAEVRAVDPSIPVPSDEAIAAVVRSGELRRPEVRAVLAELETAFGQAKIEFPAALHTRGLR